MNKKLQVRFYQSAITERTIFKANRVILKQRVYHYHVTLVIAEHASIDAKIMQTTYVYSSPKISWVELENQITGSFKFCPYSF